MMAGVAWLTDALGVGTLLAVEIAFGADLTDVDGSGWVWTDVTPDVRVVEGINLKIGKGNGASASQPASCGLVLNDPDGDYSPGGLSQYYPYIRANTPVRITVNPAGGGAAVAFLGGAANWEPGQNGDGSNPVVYLTASGTLRRLIQGSSPVMSPMRRVLLSSSDVVAYWPCEDGSNAQNIAAAVGPYAMTFYSAEHPGGNPDEGAVPPDLASYSGFISSDPVLKLDGSELYGHVGGYDGSAGKAQVRMLIDFQSPTDQTVILGIQTTGSTNISVSSELWEVRYKTGGILNVRGWSRGALIEDHDYAFNIDGLKGQLGFRLAQNGSDIDWQLDWLEEGSEIASYVLNTEAGYTFGNVARIQINTDGGNDNVAIGHVALLNAITDIFDNYYELNAYDEDSATGPIYGRIPRLCAENGVNLVLHDPSTGTSYLDDMGPQGRDDLVTLLREAEKVDHGILWDGKDVGLTYTGRRYREANVAVLTIDGSEILPGDFKPVKDDQRICNQFTASREGGGFWTYEDTDGSMGTDVIGMYDGSDSFNCWSDESLPHFASWEVAAGTVEGYRYPSLSFDVATIADRVDDVLALIPGDRVDVTNFHDVWSRVPDADIRLAVEGYTMRLDSHRWVVTLNTSPHGVWDVGILEADVGDTQVAGDYAMHLDTDGSTLASGVSAGATSMSVATTDSTSPLWTTDSDDLPFVLDVGGVPVTVTAISGSSSPQTFTVTGSTVARAFAAGTPVKLWTPTRLAI